MQEKYTLCDKYILTAYHKGYIINTRNTRKGNSGGRRAVVCAAISLIQEVAA